MNKDGKQFMCGKHGIDYRITCDECQTKHEELTQTLEEARIDYGEGWESYKDYEESNS